MQESLPSPLMQEFRPRLRRAGRARRRGGADPARRPRRGPRRSPRGPGSPWCGYGEPTVGGLVGGGVKKPHGGRGEGDDFGSRFHLQPSTVSTALVYTRPLHVKPARVFPGCNCKYFFQWGGLGWVGVGEQHRHMAVIRWAFYSDWFSSLESIKNEELIGFSRVVG